MGEGGRGSGREAGDAEKLENQTGSHRKDRDEYCSTSYVEHILTLPTIARVTFFLFLANV